MKKALKTYALVMIGVFIGTFIGAFASTYSLGAGHVPGLMLVRAG
jgi:hypothetical protein